MVSNSIVDGINGIIAVVKPLSKYQNRIEGVESKILYTIPIGDVDEEIITFSSLEKINEFILDFLPDAVVFHGVFFKQYKDLSNILYKLGVPYFIEPHCSLVKEALRKSRFKKWIAINIYLRSFLSKSRGAIFLNEEEKAKSVKKTKRDLCIPNGIEIERSGRINNKKNTPIKILYLGRIDFRHKGIDKLISIIKRMSKETNEIEIHIYGGGNEKEVALLKSEVEDINDQRYKFFGVAKGELKQTILNTYDIMIMTSRYEGLPVVVLEALSCGMPCIVTPGTNVLNMLVENKLGWGLHENDEITSILQAVEEYEKNFEEYHNRTREYAIKNFLWEKIASDSIEKIKKEI